MDALTVTYRSGGRYLLPSTTPSTPGLTPNASSTSSYSLSSSPSSASFNTSNVNLHPISATTGTGTCASPRGTPARNEGVARPVIARAGSRPSLRHMPSWRSFTSHVSLKSRGSEVEDPDEAIFQSSEDEAFVREQREKTPMKDRFRRGRERKMKTKRVIDTGTLQGDKVDDRGLTHPSTFAKALKKLSLGSLSGHEQVRKRNSIPRQMVDQGESGRLSPVPLSPQSSHSELEVQDEYFTPPSISTAILQSVPSLPTHVTLPRGSLRPKQWTGEITPTPVHTPAKERPPPAEPVSSGPAEESSSPLFNSDIFSPRVRQAPVLRGIIDSLPVSPLELPISRLTQSTTTSRMTEYPTPVLPRNTTPSPILSANIANVAMPSLGQVVSDLQHSSSFSRPRSTVNPSYRLPRASIPTSGSTPTLFPTSYTQSSLPFTRRHSAIIRPQTLPSPVPPSLITSPRSLGTPLIPPGPTSPSRLDTLAGRPPPGFVMETVPDILADTRARRASAILRAGAMSPTSGLGFGAMTQAGSGFRKAKEGDGGSVHRGYDRTGHRLPTPGTFGLEGEAEQRMITEGINPYFA